jgi:hypothetical protein
VEEGDEDAGDDGGLADREAGHPPHKVAVSFGALHEQSANLLRASLVEGSDLLSHLGKLFRQSAFEALVHELDDIGAAPIPGPIVGFTQPWPKHRRRRGTFNFEGTAMAGIIGALRVG